MHAITEATLEMHFHASLMSLFRDTCGLGPGGSIQFFKYSPQLEKFVGFDQAYVRTDLSPEELLRDLRTAARIGDYHLRRVIVGYFLQFKVVKRMVKRSKSMPLGFSVPYCRAELDTQRRATNERSQHELLFALASNPRAMVYYACPMIFDRVELYRPVADLDQLVLVDVSSAPGAYTDNERHFVAFQRNDSPPTWCSDPVPGKGLDPKSFVEQLAQLVREPALGAANRSVLLNFLDSPKQFVIPAEDGVPVGAMQALTVVCVTYHVKAS